MFNGSNLTERELPIEPRAMLCSTIRKLYSSDEIRRGIVFDEQLEEVQGMVFLIQRLAQGIDLLFLFSVEFIKETFQRQIYQV